METGPVQYEENLERVVSRSQLSDSIGGRGKGARWGMADG